jgi:hypothetical protein
MLLGFVDKSPAVVELELYVKGGDLLAPSVAYDSVNPDNTLRVFEGSDGVWAAMNDAGLMKPCATHTEAATLVS